MVKFIKIKTDFFLGESEMELDDATKNLAEANTFLNPDIRSKMKDESHLGELTDLVILKQGAEKVEKWLPVLKKIHPMNNTFDDLPDAIKKEIAKFTPKPEKKIEPKPVTETVSTKETEIIKEEKVVDDVVKTKKEEKKPLSFPGTTIKPVKKYVRRGGN